MTATPKRRPAEDGDDGVFDLDVLEKEAHHDPFRFRRGGREYTIPHLRDLDTRLLLQADNDRGETLAAFQAALGDEWDEFMSTPLSAHALDALFAKWAEHSGLRVGESPASTSSSRRTARR